MALAKSIDDVFHAEAGVDRSIHLVTIARPAVDAITDAVSLAQNLVLPLGTCANTMVGRLDLLGMLQAVHVQHQVVVQVRAAIPVAVELIDVVITEGE